jgi:hypothetical protein
MKLQYTECSYTMQQVQRGGEKGLKITGSSGAIIDAYSFLKELERMGIVELYFPPLDGDNGLIIISKGES